jgi:hypothetical protein
MKDESSRDACRNRKDSAPQPIRKHAKDKDRKASPQSDLEKRGSHGLTALSVSSGHCPYCFAVALAQNEQREKRQWPNGQCYPEPGSGRSAAVAGHVVGGRHRGNRDELNDQPHRHGPTIAGNSAQCRSSPKSEAARLAAFSSLSLPPGLANSDRRLVAPPDQAGLRGYREQKREHREVKHHEPLNVRLHRCGSVLNEPRYT